MTREYKKTSPEIKAKAVLEALKENEEIAVIAARYDVDPRNMKEWKAKFIQDSASVFENKAEEKLKDEIKSLKRERDELHKKVGEQTIFQDWFKKNIGKLDSNGRTSLLDSDSKLSIRKQCEAMKLPRSTVYKKPKPLISDDDFKIMKLILILHNQHPFYGCRKIRHELREQYQIRISKNKVLRLIWLMGIRSIGPRPNTSRAMKEHKKYAYLLRNLTIDKPNHVWSTDITYIETQHGFCFLVAIVDWYSRAILSYRISNTMESSFCIEALEEAIAKYGAPEIFNTDQGSQFTCSKFIEVLERNNVNISMDGKGRATDNAVIERFWRNIKYEDILLRQYKTMEEVKHGVAKYMDFYNNRRPHAALGYRNPMKVYANFSLPTFITNPGECKISEVKMEQVRKSILKKLVY